ASTGSGRNVPGSRVAWARVSPAVAVVTPALSSAQMFEAFVVRPPQRGCRQFVVGHEAADAGERRAREGAPPRGDERGAVGAGGEREKQFVILAVGEGGAQVVAASAGDGVGLDGGGAAGGRERVDVFREAVAEVHHGADFGAGGEPAARSEERRVGR